MPWAQYSAYFTEEFWKRHVYDGPPDLIKKAAERIYQWRDVDVNTIIDIHAVRCLAAEVQQRQPAFAANPAAEFESRDAFEYWERRGQRARRNGPARIRYAVRKDATASVGGLYQISHFAGVV